MGTVVEFAGIDEAIQDFVPPVNWLMHLSDFTAADCELLAIESAPPMSGHHVPSATDTCSVTGPYDNFSDDDRTIGARLPVTNPFPVADLVHYVWAYYAPENIRFAALGEVHEMEVGETETFVSSSSHMIPDWIDPSEVTCSVVGIMLYE